MAMLKFNRYHLVRCLILFIYIPLWGCQPTPSQQAVIEHNSITLQEKLEHPPLLPYSYEAPAEINEDIVLNTTVFHIKAKVEISDSQIHPVYQMKRRNFTYDETKNMIGRLVSGAIGIRDANVPTKEEIEENILIVKQGLPVYNDDGTITYAANEHADKVLPELYKELEKAKPESFDSFLEPEAIYPFPGDFVLLQTNNAKAYCFMQHESLAVFPNDYGNIQMQSWIARDGGWEGEGPVTLTPAITLEEAKQDGEKLLSNLNIDNMYLADAEEARMLDGLLGYNTLSIGWYLTFTRKEGNGIPFDSQSVSQSLMNFSEEASYAPPWPQETISILLDSSGVRFLTWRNPCETLGQINSNVSLLPFDEVYKRAISLIKQGFSWADQPGIKNEEYYVNRILLTNCLVRQKDDSGVAIWMPTWVFVYQAESRLDNSIVPGYIAINAIDGARVEIIR